MSDDEEIISRSSDLYKHLIDQGYSDFTSLNSSYEDISNKLQKTNNSSRVIDRTHIINDNKSYSARNIVSINDHNKLLTIIKSQLLFKEDIDILETIMSTTCVYKSKLNLYSYVSVGIGGLFLSTISLCRSRISCCIPFGLTVLCTTFSIWLFYLQMIETHENEQFASHVSLLQKLCSNIHRVFRCLKETEIISTGQVSNHNIGVAAYSSLPIGLGFHSSKQLDTLPPWKTLPQVRVSLMNVLIDTINFLNEACETLKASFVTQHIMNNYECSEYQNNLKTLDEMLNINQCISLKNLQSINDIYLAVQSAYLKWIALSLFNICNTSPKVGHKKGLFKVIFSLHLKLADLSSKLILQYQTHIRSSLTNTSYKHNTKQRVDNKVHSVQVEVHNISLLVLSILLRVRNLEDFLAEVTETSIQTNLNNEIKKQLVTIKDDLIFTVKCYDNIYSQFLSGNKVVHPEKTDIENCKSVIEQKSKETGVVVGTSDFNVNSPDEVFLAISGDNNRYQEEIIDDWLFETKPQIPKNLLEELNKTLKSRKVHFSEREKIALERQGLQDIQDNLDSSSDESSQIKTTQKKQTPKTTKKKIIHQSCSSDNVNDNLAIWKKMITKKKTSYNTLSEDLTSDSENSFSDGCTFTKQHENNMDNLSLAKIIAMKSHMWKKSEEENYSDG